MHELRTWRFDEPLDPVATLGTAGFGALDPGRRIAPGSIRAAVRTPAGPVTVRVERAAPLVEVETWGPGAAWVLDRVPALLGFGDCPGELEAQHRIVRDTQRRHPGLRLSATGLVVEALVPAVVEQKVTGRGAKRSLRLLVARHGRPAPGPPGHRTLPPPEELAALESWDYHRLGVERRRADTLRRALRRHSRLEEITSLDADSAVARLTALPGIGPWTAARVAGAVGGDPDLVVVGDYNLPSLVAWALAGEPRGDDARMLALLEPYRGQRRRVQILLKRSGARPPRYGPRLPVRSIAAH